MATIRWFNSINGFSVGDELTEVIDTSGNVFTSKITSYIDVDIVSDNGNNIWNFDSTGNVVFPDTTTQTTAYPGTANTLSLTGNIAAGNANLGNLVTANFFSGNGSLLTGINVSAGNSIVNGNSNVFVTANGNVTISVAGIANVVNVTGSNVLVSANIIPTANITYDLGNNTNRFKDLYLSGNTIKLGDSNISSNATTVTILNGVGGQLIVGGNNTINTADLSTNSITNGNSNVTVTANGNITTSVAGNANILIVTGTGANIAGTLNVSGNITVGNANLGNLTTSNFFHGVFDATSSSQPNITSLGNLTSLTVTGNVAAGNVLTDHLLYANGAAWDIGGIPAGSNTQVQFNDNSEFGASANLTFNSITNTLTTANISAANGVFSGNSINGKNALQVGVTGFTSVPNTIAQYTSNLNSASQINFQNINTGATSSTDIALTSDNGNSVNNYINMGITGSAWDGTQTNSLGNALTPDDGYLYVRGGNLVIGTSKIPSAVKFIVGGSGTGNIVATINRTNVDVTGDIIASGNANITGNISSTAGSLTLSTGVLAVSGGDAGIFTTAIGNINFGLVANISMGSTTGNVTARGNLIVNNTAIIPNLKVNDIYSNRTPIVVTANTVIDSFPVNQYRSAKYTMRVNSDDGYQAVEVLLIHDSANSYVTIYGSLSTVGFDIIALSTNILSGNVRLLATTGSANTTVNLLGVYVAD